MAGDRKYIPATMVQLKIRLEDFTGGGDEDAQSEQKPFDEKVKHLDKLIKKLSAQQATLRASNSQADQATLVKVTKQIRRDQRAKKKLQEEAPISSSQAMQVGDVFSIDLLTVPQSMNINHNGSRIADTVSLSFPFRDAPLISDIIRAAQIDVLAGTIPEEDFATPDRWKLSFNRSTIMFRGFVDSWESSHGDDDATVDIDARSMEAVLIDSKINPLSKSFRIHGDGEKISAYVNRILEQHPSTSGNTGGDRLRAAWYGASASGEPTLSRKSLIRSLQTAQSRGDANGGQVAGAAGGDPAAAVGPAGQPNTPQKTPGQEMSVWDLITQACNLAGCVPIYDPSLPVREVEDDVTGGFATTTRGRIDPANTILLRPPQTIFEEVDGGISIPGGAADGFSRTFSDQRTGNRITSQVRFMVWGHNIKEMRTSRKLGRIKAPAVEVRSYNPDAPPGERLLVARYPETKRASKIGPKGEAKVDEVVTRVIRGVRDMKILKQTAVGLYHAIGRQELSVNIKTDDMASYIDPLSGEKHNDNPDILRLRPGSPCRVTVAREVKDPSKGLVLSPLSELFEQRTSQIERFLREQLGRYRKDLPDNELNARVQRMVTRIATALSSAKITDLFYCRTVSHDWDVESGWSTSMELVNFLEARSLPKNLGTGDQQSDAELRLNPKLKTPARKATEVKNKAVARYEDSLRRLL